MSERRIKLSSDPRHTRNLFAPLSDVADRMLAVLERNSRGDCLCMVDGRYLIDVDYRDVEKDGDS